MVDLRRHWRLNEDGVNLRALIQGADDSEELGRREIGGRRDFFTVNAELGAGLDLVANIDLGGWVVSNEDDGESGRAFERADARFQGEENLVAHPLAVEGLGAHPIGENSKGLGETPLTRRADHALQ